MVFASQTVLLLAALTVVRWTVKTVSKNEFDLEVPASELKNHPMLQICKFCQIIANRETLCYEDDKVAVFQDISKQAAEHLIVCPKDHIKDINKLSKRHVELLIHMKKVANKLL